MSDKKLSQVSDSEKRIAEIRKNANLPSFQDRFSGGDDEVVKSKYIGLLTVDEFKKASEGKLEETEAERIAREKREKKEKKRKLKVKKKRMAALSFATEEDEEDDNDEKMISRNPASQSDADRDGEESPSKRQKNDDS